MVAMLGRPWAWRTTSSATKPCFVTHLVQTRATAGVESTSTPSRSKSTPRHTIFMPSMILGILLDGCRSQMKSQVQIMKFGGTSVGDASCIGRAAQIVAQAARENAVTAVVSAMSGVTNRLVEAANRAGSGDREAGSALIAGLRQQHTAALAALVSDESRRAGVASALDEIFAEGRRRLDGTALLRELTPRALDAISSLGERLCAPIFASALLELGVKSQAIAATELIVTDTFHGGAEPRMDLTRGRCEATLRPLLNESCVPVVTGFIGASPDGVLTTLGRGRSDYSDTVPGAALSVDDVIIWTDVDGVLTADPRLVPD